MNDPQVEDVDGGSASLSSRIARGDSEAEVDFVTKFYQPVLILAKRQVRDESLAEDITQDVLSNLIVRFRQGQAIQFLAAHLRTAVVHAAAKARRSQARRGDATDPQSIAGHESLTSTESVVQMNIVADALAELLDELPMKRDREILRSYLLDEQEKGLLVEKFGLTPEHFDRILHRARMRLRTLLSARMGAKP